MIIKKWRNIYNDKETSSCNYWAENVNDEKTDRISACGKILIQGKDYDNL